MQKNVDYKINYDYDCAFDKNVLKQCEMHCFDMKPINEKVTNDNGNIILHFYIDTNKASGSVNNKCQINGYDGDIKYCYQIFNII